MLKTKVDFFLGQDFTEKFKTAIPNIVIEGSCSNFFFNLARRYNALCKKRKIKSFLSSGYDSLRCTPTIP